MRFDAVNFTDRTEIPGYVDAYLRTHPRAKSRAGARASCSRLLKRVEVRAALAWHCAIFSNEIPWEPPPETVEGIAERLKELGNWRVR